MSNNVFEDIIENIDELKQQSEELKTKVHILNESATKMENIIGYLGQENKELKDLLLNARYILLEFYLDKNQTIYSDDYIWEINLKIDKVLNPQKVG